MKSEISERVENLLQPILDSKKLELVDVEYVSVGRSACLRILIDRDGGVTLDDCAEVSRELSIILDVDDFIPVRYTLEVSSPGLDRPLKKPSDYERFAGQLAKICTHTLFSDEGGNRRKTFYGHIIGVEDSSIRMKLKEGQEALIPFSLISKANLQYEF